MQVSWTREAVEALDSVAERINRFSSQRAARAVDDILVRIQQIADFPESGRIVPEHGNAHLREVLVGPYRVIYRLTSEGITIETIVHGSVKLD